MKKPILLPVIVMFFIIGSTLTVAYSRSELRDLLLEVIQDPEKVQAISLSGFRDLVRLYFVDNDDGDVDLTETGDSSGRPHVDLVIDLKTSVWDCTDMGLGTPQPITPIAGQGFRMMCPTVINQQKDCLRAYVDGNACTFLVWGGTKPVFDCPAESSGPHTAKCEAISETLSHCCAGQIQEPFTIS